MFWIKLPAMFSFGRSGIRVAACQMAFKDTFISTAVLPAPTEVQRGSGPTLSQHRTATEQSSRSRTLTVRADTIKTGKHWRLQEDT